MPYAEPDHDDPMELTSVELEATEAEVLDMASCFAEEFARLGYDSRGIMALFENPEYPPAHSALQQLGAAKVRGLIAEAVFIYGRSEG